MLKLKEAPKKIIYLFKESFNHFLDDNALKLSASLSYYTIFSLPPLLIIIISFQPECFSDLRLSADSYLVRSMKL